MHVRAACGKPSAAAVHGPRGYQTAASGRSRAIISLVDDEIDDETITVPRRPMVRPVLSPLGDMEDTAVPHAEELPRDDFRTPPCNFAATDRPATLAPPPVRRRPGRAPGDPETG